MARSAPSLSLVVPKRSGLAALGVSALLHALALGSALAVAFGAAGTLPDVVGTVSLTTLPIPEIVPPPPPPAAPPTGLKGRLASAVRPAVVDATMRQPPEIPDSIPEPEPTDFIGGGLLGPVGDGVPGGDPFATGDGRSPIGGFGDEADVARPQQPMRVSSIAGPRKVHHVSPIYPQVAVEARIEGKVEIDCVIDEEGRVTALTVLEGNAILAPAAAEAVRQWRYTPTLVTGVPTPVLMKVTVHFALHR